MKLLLLSNSTMAGEAYLQYPLPYIKDFLGNKSFNAVFIPYAGVTISWDDYLAMVNNRFAPLNCIINPIHKKKDPVKALENCDLIIVGGGNTFHLLKLLQDIKLINVIKQKTINNTPYIGWSAGANMACPTICTTNDMPIVEPESLESLNLIPFQINPHYTDKRPPGHAGETRDARIEEYIEANKNRYVVGLREGSVLKIIDQSIQLLGTKKIKIFKKGISAYELDSQDDLTFLLNF